MSYRFPKAILVDTGYWFALFTGRDQYHENAKKLASLVENVQIIFPWPCAYETLNSAFVKNRLGVDRLDALLKSPRTMLLDDAPYRLDALEATVAGARRSKRTISLVDMVIRLVLADTNVRVDGLLTFNLRDFVDVCRTRRIECLGY